jgi:transcription-repair coupling factor (superfamily II helicase)
VNALKALTERLWAGEIVDLTGVDADFLAHLVTQIHQALDRPIILLAPDAADARRLTSDLQVFASPEQVAFVPHVEASPFGDLSPDRGVVMRHLAALARLAWGDAPNYTVLTPGALARKVVPTADLVEHSHVITVDADLDREACLRALATGGYHAVSSVEDPGTFAVRGSILDVYPPHLPGPIRVDLWGDTVESIRFFDPGSQRTREDGPETVVLPPVREEILAGDYQNRARRGIIDAGAAAQLPSRTLQPLLDDLRNGIPFMGIEGFRPAFYEQLATLDSYLPDNAIVVLLDPMGIGERLRAYWDRLSEGYQGALDDKVPALLPEMHAQSPAQVLSALEGQPQLRAHVLQMVDELGAVDGPEDALDLHVPLNTELITRLRASRGDREPLAPLAKTVRDWVENGARVVITAQRQVQSEQIFRLMRSYNVPIEAATGSAAPYLRPPRSEEAGVVLLEGDVSGGFQLLDQGYALITEAEIFGQKARKRRRRRSKEQASPFVQNFRELEPQDFVVHADHGIGRYVGLQKLVVGGTEADFLVVQFAGNDKLYLPVYKLGRLQKYVGGGAKPRVDKLGGTAWQKVRSKAKASAEEDAYALLELYARRELAEGYGFTEPNEYFRTFEATFPFEETPDQARAIDEVIADMVRARPMDRLLCGDVGFGKTEVALRAAMKAITDAKQVAVLVPTTVLALQHYRTFEARFADYPINVRLLSRLTTRDESKQVLKGLKTGGVDIVVGTHRVLSKDVQFNDLGLLILDEEHRFGVRHKERLKEVRANVDVLAMTATPIPRTLQLSMSGIRDLSVITTPPNDRLSVRTYVCRATDQVVRDAVLRELGRGGQVFFVHNRVHSIEARKAWLTSLVPEARIVVGHGQMEPKKLSQVMLDFTEGRFNVLLATTIIESGIDIPNANTMLVDHADQLGLAQLYQLRGRVGRSKARGYCYLLVPGEAALSGDARKRLAVIQKFTELGSGFQVASHDMELRGAGELLGTRQKGQMQAVGIDLYAQLLDDAVRTLRGEPAPVEFDPDINLPVTARLPEDYISDGHLRLVLYKRMANADQDEDVLAIADEMGDRFGALPGAAMNLVEVMRIRCLARQCGLKSVDHGGDRVLLTVHPESPLPIERIIDLVSDPRSGFTAPADFKLLYVFDHEERRQTVPSTRMCLQRLAELTTETT